MRPRAASLNFAAVLLLALLLAGCARFTPLLRHQNAVVVEDLFEVWASGVRTRRGRVAIQLHVANTFDEPIVLRVDELHCARGEALGVVRVLSDATRPHIRLGTDEVRELLVLCELPTVSDGDLRVIVGHVYDGSGTEAPGREQILATDVEWFVSSEHVP